MASMLLGACMGGPSASNDVVAAKKQKSGFMGLSTTEDVVVATPAAFKGVNKVQIGSFTVGFATYKTDSAKAGGGLMGNGFGGKSTAKSTLVGVDDATMQKITDAVYKQFVADLQASGYTVVDRASLVADAGYAKLASAPNPYESSDGGLFGANSKTKFFAPTEFGGTIRPLAGEVPGIGSVFGIATNATTVANYAKASGNKVLSVVYVIDFANSEGYGGTFRSTSSVEVGQGLTVVPQYSKINIIGGDAGTFATNNGSMTLGQPVMSTREFAAVSDSTSGASRGMEMAANIVGVLGGVGTNAKRDYTFTARPDDYSTGTIEALGNANKVFVAKAQSLR